MLEDSRITKIDAGTFSGLEKLSYLAISWNKINSIHPDAFVDNVNLNYFYANYNQLSTLNATILRNNPNIQYITLGRNINAIERNFFDSFANSLRQVTVDGFCINRNFYSFANFTTQVQPYFRNCYNKYDALFPTTAGVELAVN